MGNFSHEKNFSRILFVDKVKFLDSLTSLFNLNNGHIEFFHINIFEHFYLILNF